MIRFNRSGKKQFDRKPAAYGKSGRVKPGWAEYKDTETQRVVRAEVGICTYDIRVEDKGTHLYPCREERYRGRSKAASNGGQSHWPRRC
jgi:hypothetical protein